MRLLLLTFVLGTFVLVSRGNADEEPVLVSPEMIPFGVGAFQVGQLNNYYARDDDKGDHLRWNQSMVALMGMDSRIGTKLHTRVAMKFRRWLFAEPEYYTEKDISLGEVFGRAAFIGTIDEPVLSLTVGQTHFKYNNDAFHLGEYLLRSGAYPPFLISDFDFSKFEALGFHLNANLFEGAYTHDVLLTNEKINNHQGDFSLTYITALKLAGILEIGGGITFNRLIPMEHEPIDLNLYLDTSYAPDSTPIIDSSYYKQEGTKIMGRINFDPKPLFGSDLFADQELNFYAEIAVLGLKNQFTAYQKITERMPIMAGFHVPTFGLLDIFALEVEYYKTPNFVGFNEFQMASVPGETWFSTQDDWRWAVYMKRSLLKDLFITGIITSDHWRLSLQEGGTTDINFLPYNKQRVSTSRNWYWRVRLTWGINSALASIGRTRDNN
ncbi:MAG: hypothetical protein HQK83_07475 [Fibrobacteria bacterium]|nr:hypothetical protein [Fibrobacteria bacterium]